MRLEHRPKLQARSGCVKYIIAFESGPGYFESAEHRQRYVNDVLRDKGFSPTGEWLGARSNMTPGAIFHDDPPTDG